MPARTRLSYFSASGWRLLSEATRGSKNVSKILQKKKRNTHDRSVTGSKATRKLELSSFVCVDERDRILFPLYSETKALQRES